MSKAVVDALEIVQVQQKQGDVPRPLRHAPPDPALQRRLIEQPRQRVLLGQLLQPGVDLDDLPALAEADGRMVAVGQRHRRRHKKGNAQIEHLSR